MNIYPTVKISWQIFRDVVYVFNEETKKVYLFSESAKDFWIAIMTNHNIFLSINSLCSIYGSNNQAAIAEDIQAFVDDLIRFGVLQKEVCDG